MPAWPPLEAVLDVGQSAKRCPGLSEHDGSIWRSFVAANPRHFQQAWFYVPVTTGPQDLSQYCPQTLAEQMWPSYAYRPDVVATRHGTIWVIELKPHATHHALGQALYYAHQFNVMYNPAIPAIPAIIARTYALDLVAIANRYDCSCLTCATLQDAPGPTIPVPAGS